MRQFLAHQLEYCGDSDKTKFSAVEGADVVVERIQEVSPRDKNQRSLKAQALSLIVQLGATRWLMFEPNTIRIPKLLLMTMVGWPMLLFLSFGIFGPRNLTADLRTLSLHRR